MLERFTLSTFASHVNETFRLLPEAADTSGSFDLVLTEATDLSTPGQRSYSAPNPRAPFSLVFLGPAAPILPQRIYRMEHADIGAFELFIVPIGPGDGGMRYQAIFT